MTKKREREREWTCRCGSIWTMNAQGKMAPGVLWWTYFQKVKVRRGGGGEEQQQQLNPDEQREVLNKPQQISYLSGRKRGGREREEGREGRRERERGTQHYLKAFGALCIGSVIAFKWQHWRDFMMQFKNCSWDNPRTILVAWLRLVLINCPSFMSELHSSWA